MNFEVIDNLFQVAVLLAGMVAAIGSAVKYHERRLVILALSYASFAMGTLFWVLHLTIRGDIPHIFYVSEISWLASWLFYLSLQIVRTEQMKVRFDVIGMVCSLYIAATIMKLQIFGPSRLMSLLFAVTMGALVYLTVFRLRSGRKVMPVDGAMCGSAVLQILLYVASAFMKEFTHFNLYFAVDIVLTVSFVSLLPLQLKEVKSR